MANRFVCLMLSTATIVACEQRPRPPVDGVWFLAGVSGDHSGVIVLSLRQQGEEVTGLACRTDSGHLVYKDVPVAGEYPRIEFADLYGCRFQSSVASAETIEGWRKCPSEMGQGQEWFFRRTSPSAYDDCASASP